MTDVSKFGDIGCKSVVCVSVIVEEVALLKIVNIIQRRMRINEGITINKKSDRFFILNHHNRHVLLRQFSMVHLRLFVSSW